MNQTVIEFDEEDPIHVKIFDMIADCLGISKDNIKMHFSIIADLGADSLDIVELILAIEDEFGVQISDEEVANIKTVSDLISYIKRRKTGVSDLF